MKAENFAKEKHSNQLYGNLSYYDGHLSKVVELLKKYTDDHIIIDAGWLHDIIEDTQTTEEELIEIFDKETISIVLSLTCNNQLKRKDRLPASYIKINSVGEKAVMVKLADRICNMESSLKEKDSRFTMYKKEYELFRKTLYNEDHTNEIKEMWSILDDIYTKDI